MPADTETIVTGRFEVECEDGSRAIVIEKTTYLIHRASGHRSPNQRDYSLNGESLYEAPIGSGVFKNAFGKTFKKVP
jgi:hypothetical protein